MMTRPCNQITRIVLATYRNLLLFVAMECQVDPDVRLAVNQREPRRGNVQPAVPVDDVRIGTRRDRGELALREGVVAPGLHVGAVEDAGDEARPMGWGGDEGAEFCAGGVQVGAAGVVSGVGPVGRVLRVKAAIIGGVEAARGAEGDDDALDIGGVVAQASPRLTLSVLGELGVYGRDVGWGGGVGNIGAELVEVLGGVGGVPV